ncbi:MAG: DUF3822 family protein [Bacteroidota bacterium]
MSVQVTLTGLSFLITAPSGAVVHFSELDFDTPHTPEELLFEITKQLSREGILQGPFVEVNVVYTTHNYSVVPQSLFDEHKASEYLKFNTKILGNDYISFDEVDGLNAVVVYVPFMNINNYLFDTFGSFSYFHASTLLMGALLSSEKHSEANRVFLHVLDGQFDCIVSKKGALELCNSYQYKTPEDFIYYVLFCFEQLNLNPDSVEVQLCGAIDEQSDLYEILYTYVRKISFVEHEHHLLSNEAPHQHYLLKSLT